MAGPTGAEDQEAAPARGARKAGRDKAGRDGKAKKPRRGLLRRFVRGAFLALGVLLVLFVGSSLLAHVITPPSTLMLARWAQLKPVDRRVVPLDAISPHVVRLVITSEDARFCRHGGVDWDELRRVIDAGALRGASTIPMQTAKNVYLWPARSTIRKAIEIPVALYIDAVWGKSRLLEIYLNIAEWGEGIFGIEAAARHHFGKSAAELTQREAALLATALPNPIARNPASPGQGHRRLADRLIARAQQSGNLAACVAPQNRG